MARRRRRQHPAGEAARRRHPWLELLQTSGPFLTLPVVDRVWPTGVPQVPAEPRRAVRAAVADALDNRGASRQRSVRTVLTQALDWSNHLRWGIDIPAALAEPVPEHGVLITPEFGFNAEPSVADDHEDDDTDAGEEDTETPPATTGPWRMLGIISEWGIHPLARTTTGGWSASPVERLAVLLRARGVPVGVVTDGRWWAIVWAPIGGTIGAAVWNASLWSEEPESFAASAR